MKKLTKHIKIIFVGLVLLLSMGSCGTIGVETHPYYYDYYTIYPYHPTIYRPYPRPLPPPRQYIPPRPPQKQPAPPKQNNNRKPAGRH